jgi:hypothetical protein
MMAPAKAFDPGTPGGPNLMPDGRDKRSNFPQGEIGIEELSLPSLTPEADDTKHLVRRRESPPALISLYN